jgi:hypothetical protein
MVMQSRGRYHDTTERGWMSKFGLWFENFSLPAVINECLMQSVGGVIRLFPNWPLEKRAAFRDLRAVGAFLVGAECSGGRVGEVKIFSEVGGELSLVNPWSGAVRIVREGRPDAVLEGKRIVFATSKSETIHFSEVL